MSRLGRVGTARPQRELECVSESPRAGGSQQRRAGGAPGAARLQAPRQDVPDRGPNPSTEAACSRASSICCMAAAEPRLQVDVTQHRRRRHAARRVSRSLRRVHSPTPRQYQYDSRSSSSRRQRVRRRANSSKSSTIGRPPPAGRRAPGRARARLRSSPAAAGQEAGVVATAAATGASAGYRRASATSARPSSRLRSTPGGGPCARGAIPAALGGKRTSLRGNQPEPELVILVAPQRLVKAADRLRTENGESEKLPLRRSEYLKRCPGSRIRSNIASHHATQHDGKEITSSLQIGRKVADDDARGVAPRALPACAATNPGDTSIRHPERSAARP